MTTIHWPGSKTVVLGNGKLVHRFASGRESWAGTNDEGRQFASDLGIPGIKHIEIHEVLHQLIGYRFYKHPHGSPIVYRDAHGIEQPAHAIQEEECVWQCTREAFGTHRSDRWYSDEPRKRMEAAGVDVDAMVSESRRLYRACQLGLTLDVYMDGPEPMPQAA